MLTMGGTKQFAWHYSEILLVKIFLKETVHKSNGLALHWKALGCVQVSL